MDTIDGRRESFQRPTTHIEEFQPKFEWRHAEAHVVLIDLPGFKEEEVKIHLDDFGILRVAGEKQVSEMKNSRFNLVFQAPGDSNFQMINGRLAQGTLCIIMPKISVKSCGDTQKGKRKKRFKHINKARMIIEIEESGEKSTKEEGRERLGEEKSEEARDGSVWDKGKQVEGGERKRGGEGEREEARDGSGWDKGKQGEGGERKRGGDEKREERGERIRGKWEVLDNGFVDGAWEVICNNRKVVCSIVVGLSLGWYISHKLR